jgi:HSP20 family molecular chaperone IbpA
MQVDAERIQAKVEHGELRVVVPKVEKHQQQSTEVSVQ